MAYTSDLRGKNLLTDIDIYVRHILSKEGICCNLEFRVFDESDEDSILWNEGGLCFQDPVSKSNLGSNDAGWFLDGLPIFIVEATFATERGQFGDGQLNRISHSLGPALNGVYGVTLVPYMGQSFVADKCEKDITSDNIGYKMCPLRKDMALFGLKISQNHKGKYLIMDLYEPELISGLLIDVIKDKMGLPNDLQKITDDILKKMYNSLGSHVYGARSKQTLSKIYYTDGTINTDILRYYTHNLESLTTSSKRDGHGLLGKNLIEMYMAKNKSTAIFVRMDNRDFDILKKRKSKEFHFIYNNPRIDVYNFDNLVFDDLKLKNKLISIKHQNLHTMPEKNFMKELQIAFNSGKIKIKKESI